MWREFMKKMMIYLLSAFVIAGVGIWLLLSKNPQPSQKADTITSITSSDKEEIKQSTKQPEDQLTIHILNLKKGDATIIQTKEDAILIDGGHATSSDQLLDYLYAQGINRLTSIIATHPDSEHIGGLNSIIRSMYVSSVYAPKIKSTSKDYQYFLLALKEHDLKLHTVEAGTSIPTSSQKLRISFIGPTKKYATSDFNSWSAVTKVSYGENKFLFMSDASKKAELDMLEGAMLESVDVLSVSNPQKSDGNSNDFLKVVHPKLTAIQINPEIKINQRTERVINRLKEVGTKIYRTDEHGQIIFQSDGKNILTKVER